MYVVFAVVAFTLIVGILAITRGAYRDRKLRRASKGKPEYHVGNNAALNEWRVSCAKSLAWSRKRRNKEVT